MTRILVNDFSGHAFPVQLSRELARRGYEVLHTYCANFQTPRGPLVKGDDDPVWFSVKPVDFGHSFEKYRLLPRWRHERRMGALLAHAAMSFRPHAIISSNTPLFTQSALLRYALSSKARFVFWVQDLYGIGIKRTLERRMPLIGKLAGESVMRVERELLARSSHIVLITPDFLPFIPSEIVDSGRVTVIENWAPLGEMRIEPRENPWSLKHELADKRCLVYSGTLGIKHNPGLLARLAADLSDIPDVRVVVISEGPGAELLSRRKRALGLSNLILLPFQPFEVLPQVMASAEVLIAVLEPDAGIFSVPSKVYTYLCAERPLLLAVPSENLAARIVREQRAGLVVDPGDVSGFVSAGRTLLGNRELARELGRNGRRYAELTFDIRQITDRFEAIIACPVRN